MCDTLVALGNSTEDGNVVFGKNSDRAQSEAQLITYTPRKKHSLGDEVKCTHIVIPQVSETASIILSQPYWIWGAEMGANEYLVVIGNEAVSSKEPLNESGLLGMDLIRLGLERGKTAKIALEIIIELLEKYGQGGTHTLKGGNNSNTMIIADEKEAYVLEAVGDWWIVEIVKDYRSISNHISIRGKGDVRKKGIITHAIEKGYCKDDNDFDFKMTFSRVSLPDKWPLTSRDGCSLNQLSTNKGKITPALMMEFLREHQVGICLHGRADRSVGSQVSHLRKGKKSIHWFTGNTIPCLGIFKPYTFPYEGKNFLKPGPYSEINPDWFWTRHDKFVEKIARRPKNDNSERNIYYGKIRTVENEILRRTEEIINTKNDISETEFNKLIREVNNYAWDKSEELVG